VVREESALGRLYFPWDSRDARGLGRLGSAAEEPAGTLGWEHGVRVWVPSQPGVCASVSLGQEPGAR